MYVRKLNKQGARSLEHARGLLRRNVVELDLVEAQVLHKLGNVLYVARVVASTTPPEPRCLERQAQPPTLATNAGRSRQETSKEGRESARGRLIRTCSKGVAWT